MTDKATENATEAKVDPQQAAAEELAAFESITGPTGDEPPEPKTQAQPTDAKQAPAKEEPKKPDGPLIAGYTEDEVRALLARGANAADVEQRLTGEIRRLYGKLGELQSRLQEEAKARPGRKVDPKAILKRVREVVPDLADPLAEDIAEMLGESAEQTRVEAQAQPQPKAEPQQPDAQPQPQSIEEVRAQIVEDVNRKFLTREHPDWMAIAKSPEFQGWLGTLPVDQRNNYVYSNDADVAGEAFSKFKQWRDARQKNRRQLEAAVVPQGAPVAPGVTAITTEEDAFNSVGR